MKPGKRLWSVSFMAAPASAAALAGALEDGALSLAIMAPPRRGKAEVEAIFGAEPHLPALQTRIAVLAALNGVRPPRLRVKELPKLDWLKKVAEDFPPLPIGRWVVFGAQHKAAAAKHRKIPLQIDATSAFGTGEHPTTRGCLVMLDRFLKRQKRPDLNMLDMGCGSGILGMAFARAARGRAVGIDLDPDSVGIAIGNIRANGLRLQMRAAVGNGYRTPLAKAGKPYDLIIANIFAGPLCRMAHDLKKHLKPGGVAILSGLLTRQANTVIAAHRWQGLRLVRHMKIGEWSVLLLGG